MQNSEMSPRRRVTDDDRRAAAIAADPLAQVLAAAIEALPAAARLYPDLYALGLARAVQELAPGQEFKPRHDESTHTWSFEPRF